MAKVICTVCGREIDSRGLSGHMKTHIGKEDDIDGVISYPSGDESTYEIDAQGGTVKKPAKKPVKKPVASKPASSPSSSPDTRGQRKTEAKHKKEWQGLFRD